MGGMNAPRLLPIKGRDRSLLTLVPVTVWGSPAAPSGLGPYANGPRLSFGGGFGAALRHLRTRASLPLDFLTRGVPLSEQGLS